MIFHCDKLCGGKCCAPLRYGLANRIHCRGKATGVAIIVAHATMRDTYQAIDDPAKLAELMASALRARMPQTWRIYGAGGDLGIGICVEMENNFIDARMTPAQARESLLTIMRMSADPSSREACERILRGDT